MDKDMQRPMLTIQGRESYNRLMFVYCWLVNSWTKNATCYTTCLPFHLQTQLARLPLEMEVSEKHRIGICKSSETMGP
ncbi:hypothetical protein Dimus_009389 [Dionaea muscipula]